MNKKIKYPLLLISLATVIWSSYQMLHLKLWGHYPLFQFSATWVILVLLAQGVFPKSFNNYYLLLSALSGILLAIGFPTSPLTPVMFIGFVPLLIVEQLISDSRAGPNKKQVFGYSYNAFVIWNILTTFWVGNTAYVGGVVAILVNALFMSVPIILFHQTKKYLDRNLAYTAFIANWLAWEYLHLNWEISWPWLTLGNSFAQYPSWVQWYEFTGVFGGSLWILLLNVIFYRGLIAKSGKEIIWDKPTLVKGGLLILLPILFSFGRYYTYEEVGKEVEVVVVQPNYEPHYEKFVVSRKQQLERFIELSESALTANTAYLVFPETSLGMFKNRQIGKEPYTRTLRDMVNKYPKLNLVTGLITNREYKEGEAHSPAVRTYVDSRRGDTIYWELYNSAVQISSDSEEIPIYFKSKQVPGAEMMPYPQLFFFLKPLADKLGGSLSGHGKQKLRSAFKSASGKVAPVICYESVYGEYTTGYVKQGANTLFIITNDGWWDNTSGHRQHLKFASLRAIETRRDIARSANTGVSCFINQRGDILQATTYGETTTIRGNIHLNEEISFYVRWGDIIGRIGVFLSVLLLLNTFVKGKMKN